LHLDFGLEMTFATCVPEFEDSTELMGFFQIKERNFREMSLVMELAGKGKGRKF